MPGESKAVFLSYASEDSEAAQRIADAVRAAGIEVWFDKSELRGGDAWDASIRKQIRECALFMPVISANTEARGEAYFRLEWRLAIERSQLMADDQVFLVPVVIDGTAEAAARVPDRFRERQWTRLVNGEATATFIEQVRRALAATHGSAPGKTAGAAAATVPKSSVGPGRRWGIAAAALIVLALVAVTWLRHGNQATRAPGPPRAAPAAAALAVPDSKSIAVLPFANLTGRPEDVYLADGLQEEILNALARMRDLKVISRTSAGEFRSATPNVREVGTRLGVGSVVEGSVRREGRTLRLTVQLIDTRNDRHILATDYDRDVSHLLGLQSEVARRVASALSATLTGYERGELERVGTNDGDAYTLYLRATALWRQGTTTDPLGVAQSRRLLEQALQLDPDYTDALALLSQACTWTFFGLQHDADAACARKSYERALGLDARLPEARLARGLYEMYVMKDLDLAMADLEAVVRLRPNAADAHYDLGFALRRRSRFNEALAHFTRGWELDPLNDIGMGAVTGTLLGLRRFQDMLPVEQIFRQRFPAYSANSYIEEAKIECRLQRSLEPLRQAFREHGGALSPVDRRSIEAEIARAEGRYVDAAQLWQTVTFRMPVERELRVALLYWAAGESVEAQRLLRGVERTAQAQLQREPHDMDTPKWLALAQSALGEHAPALATIERLRTTLSEARDPVNGPPVSFVRSIILVRAGRSSDGYAEVARLLRVPFGAPISFIRGTFPGEIFLLVKDDRHYDEIINYPPRL